MGHSYRAAIAGAVLLATTGIGQAAPIIFFGEDPGNGTPATNHPTADAAKTSFFGNLSGVGTETFEGFAVGASGPFVTTFGSAGTATLTGAGAIAQGASASNQFPISGNKYFNTTGTFSLAFSGPVSAFGFYGTDIGDAGGTLVLTLTGSNGVTQLTVTNPYALTPNVADGSALYYGFYDTANTYTSIQLSGAGGDVFGFDDFSIGSRTQVVPVKNGVPEPETVALLGVGLLGAGALRRRKSR